MKESRKIMKSQKGIALMMVLSSVSLLTIIMASFSFDNRLNVMNANNMQSRGQAKLNAESGLRWSMLMLNVYRELFNKIEVNENVKKFVPSSTINTIWSTPFIYPIPELPKASISQKGALKKFHEDNFLTGSMNVSIRNLSGKLNLNLLRYSITEISKSGDLQKLYDGEFFDEKQEKPTFAKRFKELLDRLIKDKLEEDSDENQELEYVETQELVDNIVYYTSDPVVSSEFPCPSCADSKFEFDNAYLVAKKAPITSLSELYLIPGWTDTLVKMIESHVTVHGAMVVDLSEVTSEILKLIMPSLTVDQIQEFYDYKNDPNNLETFDKIANIKNYFVKNTDVSSEDFDKRVETLEKSGIIFGSSASLFEVKSIGEVDRSTYSITAIVTLPQLPKPKPLTKEETQNNLNNQIQFNDLGDDENQNNQNTNQQKAGEDLDYPAQLLKPRVIHLSIN